MSDPSDDFNAIVNTLNRANQKLQIYREDWAALPPAVKTAIKNRTIEMIDEAINDLGSVKTEIGNI